MAQAKKKRKTTTKARSKRTKAVRRSAPRRLTTRSSGVGFGLATATRRVPPPQTGVPKPDVGTTVQRFIDWDGVKDLTVEEESSGGTFTVTPTA